MPEIMIFEYQISQLDRPYTKPQKLQEIEKYCLICKQKLVSHRTIQSKLFTQIKLK